MTSDRDRAASRGDQLIECQVRKVAVEASLHSAQMLLLDVVDVLSDETLDPVERQLGVERLHATIRRYLMTSAWVLPPDRELLSSLSLLGAEEVAPPRGDGGGATSTGEPT